MTGLCERFPGLAGREPRRLVAAMKGLGPVGESWLTYAAALLTGCRLDPQVREVAILRVAWLLGGGYAWGGHAVMAGDVGLDLRPDQGSPADHRVAVAAVDQLVSGGRLEDGLRGLAAGRWGDAGVLELVLVVGQYVTVCLAAGTLGLPAEAGCPALPAAWPGPEPADG